MQGKNIQQKGWKQCYLIDRKQLDSFAKQVYKLFAFSSSIAPWNDRFSKIIAEGEQSENKTAKEQRDIVQKLNQIGSNINSFRQTLKDYDQTNQFLVKVQNNSQNILAKLEQFRSKMAISYEQLAEEQSKLSDELSFMNKKIETFGEREELPIQQKQNIKTGNKQIRTNRIERQKCKQTSSEVEERQAFNKLDFIERRMKQKEKEVQNIQKQICSLGKNMGWPQQDHHDFMSIWHRGSSNKNYFQIQEELQAYFAFYTHQQIQEHMNKYIKWKKITEEKKQNIAQFKTLKEQKKIEELRLMNLQRDKSKEDRDKMELKKRQQKQQNQLKQKVLEWKQVKLRQKKEQQYKIKRQQIIKKRQEAIRRKQAVQSKKQILQVWRQQQTQKKDVIKRVQSARKPPTDKQTEERIRKREEELITKKIQILNDKKRQQYEQKQKEDRIRDQKFIKFSHVNNKLEHKTTAMKQKQRQKFDGKDKKQANTFGGQLLMTGVRATPNWLKGI